MVLLSLKSIVLLYAAACTAIGLACVTAPQKVLDQGVLLLLRDAMQLHDWPHDAAALAPAGLVLLNLALLYWVLYLRNDTQTIRALAPVRFLASSTICIYAYARSATAAPEIANGVVFGLAFGDVIFQYWMFTAAREGDGKTAHAD